MWLSKQSIMNPYLINIVETLLEFQGIGVEEFIV